MVQSTRENGTYIFSLWRTGIAPKGIASRIYWFLVKCYHDCPLDLQWWIDRRHYPLTPQGLHLSNNYQPDCYVRVAKMRQNAANRINNAQWSYKGDQDKKSRKAEQTFQTWNLHLHRLHINNYICCRNTCNWLLQEFNVPKAGLFRVVNVLLVTEIIDKDAISNAVSTDRVG